MDGSFLNASLNDECFNVCNNPKLITITESIEKLTGCHRVGMKNCKGIQYVFL